MTSDSNQKTGSTADPARASWFQRRVLAGNRLHRWLIVILAVGCAGLYVWRMVTVHQLRSALDTERAALQAQVQGEVTAQMRAALRVTGWSLRWAASQAMDRDDTSGIDAQITRMVKEGPVELIAVLDGDGAIRVATNKKLEGTMGSVAFPGVSLAATDVTVAEHEEGLVVVAPLERSLGTAVLFYDEPALAKVEAPAEAPAEAPEAAEAPQPAEAQE